MGVGINSDKKLPQGAWQVVILLFFVGALNYLDRSMITTMRGSIVDAIPMTDAQFGLLTSVFLWVYGLLSPFAGFLADKFSRRKVIIVSLCVWSAVTLLTSYATTFNELLATRALMGISEACYIPASLALIMDYHRGSTRSTASALNMTGIMVGSSLGFLGGWIAEHHSWNLAFSIFGVIGIFYAICLIFLLRDAPKTVDYAVEPTEGKFRLGTTLSDLFKRRSFVLMILFWGLLGVVGWIVMGWLPTYYEKHFNLSQSMAGLYATAYLYPAALVGLLLGGLLADRWTRLNPSARIMLPALGLLIAAPAIFAAGSTPLLYIAIICFIVYSITQRFSDANLMPILCMVVDKRYRATAYGVVNLFSTLVGGLGIYAGGVMRDAHIDLGWLYKSAAVAMVLCAGLLWLVKRNTVRTASMSNVQSPVKEIP